MYNPAMNESSSEFASGKAPSGRTQWHRILGALLELLLTRLGIIVQSEVQVMSDPPKVDIVLLRRVRTMPLYNVLPASVESIRVPLPKSRSWMKPN